MKSQIFTEDLIQVYISSSPSSHGKVQNGVNKVQYSSINCSGVEIWGSRKCKYSSSVQVPQNCT